jgi:hypothetical protein
MQKSILTLVVAFMITAVGYANPVRFDGCDYELEKFQNLASYGPFHITPDPGDMYVRLILKVYNRDNSPKSVIFQDIKIKDVAGQKYSASTSDGRNPMDTIQPGFSCEAEIVFMVAATDLGHQMSFVMTKRSHIDPETLTVYLPINNKLEEIPRTEEPAQEVLSCPKVVNGRYVYDDSGVTPTPRP